MNALLDTLLNVMVFAFIGLLIWLYFKKEPADSTRDDLLRIRTEEKG